MTDKIVLTDLVNLQNETTAVSAINSNNAAIRTALNNTLSRDGTTPNQMTNSLDMNSQQIINLPVPSGSSSPARLIDVVSNPTIVIPGTGTSGHVVGYLDTNNTYSGNDAFSGNNTHTGTNTFSNTVTFTGSVIGVRKALTADLTIYVDVTLGNDGNSGLAPGAGNALKTINKAVALTSSFDLFGHNLTIQLADGTYPESVALVPYVGRGGQGHTGPIIIQGNMATPANVVIAPGSGNGFTGTETGGFEWLLQGMKITAPAAAVYSDVGSWVCVNNIDFGVCGAQHMIAVGGFIEVVGNYKISGGTIYHLFTGNQGKILFGGAITVTLTGTPAFSGSFLYGADLGYASIQVAAPTVFTGAATGKRYDITNCTIINTGGGGATFFPGNIAGTATNGAVYA
jgi:hypothetical protein